MAALIKLSSGALGLGVAIVTGKNLQLAFDIILLLVVRAIKECLEVLPHPHSTHRYFPLMSFTTVLFDKDFSAA